MKIIIDDKIPYIKEAAEKIAEEVIYAPGKDFTRELVQDADALIIRTRTHCNRELLEGSKVKFTPQQPSDLTISTPNTASRRVSSGQMPRDAIPPRWLSIYNPLF